VSFQTQHLETLNCYGEFKFSYEIVSQINEILDVRIQSIVFPNR